MIFLYPFTVKIPKDKQWKYYLRNNILFIYIYYTFVSKKKHKHIFNQPYFFKAKTASKKLTEVVKIVLTLNNTKYAEL